MIAAFSLFIGELVYAYSIQHMFSLKRVIVKIKPYTIGFLTGLGFFIAHHLQKQWLVYHQESPWYGSFEFASFKKVIVNIGITGWRMIDFGLMVAWILFSLLFFDFKQSNATRRYVFLYILIVGLGT